MQGLESSHVKCAFWQCRHARLAFLRLLEPESLASGVPAADDDAALFGVDVDEAEDAGLLDRSTSFLSGDPDPDGDLAAVDALPAFDGEEDALEYKL